MDWYKVIKTAKNEIGHGNTLEGQKLKQELERVAKEIDRLKTAAITGGPESVLPRWRGEIRHKIMLLPAISRLARMSMYELNEVSAHVKSIRNVMEQYSAKRFMEIMNANKSGE